jgi:hypothetical protein
MDINIILPSMPTCSRWSSIRLLHQDLYAPLLSPIRATWSAHLSEKLGNVSVFVVEVAAFLLGKAGVSVRYADITC